MPLYTYYCTICEAYRTLSHPMYDAQPKLCAVCFHPMQKRPDLGGISFKGSGFYRTDK